MIEKNDWHFQPEFSPYIFWDRNISRLNFQLDSAFIIQRVFEMGKLSDLTELTAFYGKEKVIDILTSSVSLRENALNLAAVIFNISKKQFKCSISTPFQLHS
jgi:hypothetical protein